MIAELLATPGVVETVRLDARFGFMALHGGGLERGTAEIARRAAQACGASLYTVEQPEDFRWHIPSHRYDPAEAPGLAQFLGHVTQVVSVHGYGREGFWTRLLLGGRHEEFRAVAAARLRPYVEGFEVVDDIERVPVGLRGLHPDNPVNRPERGGVQIELPPRVRGQGPRGRVAYVDSLVEGLAAVFS